MGGRGTFAKGIRAGYRWETVGVIGGVKVLDLIDKTISRKLPEESHSSKGYLLLDNEGVFKQYREYNEKHELVFEIGFDREQKIDKSKKKVLHAHDYGRDFSSRTTRRLTIEEFNKYKELFIGVII